MPSLDLTEPPPAPAPRRRLIAVAFAAGVALSLAVSAAAVRMHRPRPAAPVPPAQVQIRFANLPAQSQLLVQGVRYWSDTAYVPRGTASLPIRIEAPGFEPLEFQLVPDRDQTVPVAMQRSAAPTPPPAQIAPAPTPEPATPSARPPEPAAPAPAANARSLPPLPTSVGSLPSDAPATLSIGGVPRWEVRIDEEPVGGTPIYNRTITAGTHRIVCTRAGVNGAALRTHTVTVTAGQRAQLFCDTR